MADLERWAIERMFGFFKNLKRITPPIDYAQEWQRLQKAYADPAIELAKTKQALIVSAACVLDRLWNGNGGLGWDESCEEDYVGPLRDHLVTDEMFSDEVRAELTSKLDEVIAVGRENLRRIAEAKDEATVLDSCVDVDFVVERTIEWCLRYPEPICLSAEDDYHGHY